MDIHYLDNAATTKPSADSLKAAADSFSEAWGNPSSAHAVGRRASALLEESRKAVLHSLGLPRMTQDRLVFTASGTEANNIAVLGCAHSKTRHETNGQLGTVIISAGEHPSVSGPASLLEKEGYKVVRIPTSDGVLSEDDIRAAVNDAQSPVILAAFMLVNNETGALYDIKKASDIIKSRFPDANIHCDAVQAFTKIRFTPSSLGADTLAVSSHKIHAPRGAGALYISKEIIKRKNISAVMPGGGQENGLRSGTENLAAIAAFACYAVHTLRPFRGNLSFAPIAIGVAFTFGVSALLLRNEARLPDVKLITLISEVSLESYLVQFISREAFRHINTPACLIYHFICSIAVAYVLHVVTLYVLGRLGLYRRTRAS